MFLFWSKGTNRAIGSPMAMEPIRVGTLALDPVLIVLALAALAVLALIVLAIALIVHMRGRRRETQAQASELAELKGRLQSFAEISVARQGDVARAVNERLDRMTHRVGTDLNETSRKTHEFDRQAQRAAGGDRHRAKEPDRPFDQHGRLAADPRQQAGARRVRPDAHGDHRSGRPAQGRLHVSGDALQRQAAGLPAAHAEHRRPAW